MPRDPTGSNAAIADPVALSGEPIRERIDLSPTAPLAGTRWRLVRYQSMDDGIGEIKPGEPSAYIMALDRDGTVRLQLNCNHATGTCSVTGDQAIS